jgi:alkylation response protein AidB-like acyl-CoA dehydrogenase
MSYYRAIAGAQHVRAPGPESSFLKIRGSEILQQCYELLMELLGENSLSWWNEPGVVPDNEQYVAPLYCYNRATTIYGGSNEIQRNIIAKLLLGLG